MPDSKKFIGWAEGQGGEALPLTNEYELARIKHANGTLVVYQNAKGHVSFSDSLRGLRGLRSRRATDSR